MRELWRSRRGEQRPAATFGSRPHCRPDVDAGRAGLVRAGPPRFRTILAHRAARISGPGVLRTFTVGFRRSRSFTSAAARGPRRRGPLRRPTFASWRSAAEHVNGAYLALPTPVAAGSTSPRGRTAADHPKLPPIAAVRGWPRGNVASGEVNDSVLAGPARAGGRAVRGRHLDVGRGPSRTAFARPALAAGAPLLRATGPSSSAGLPEPGLQSCAVVARRGGAGLQPPAAPPSRCPGRRSSSVDARAEPVGGGPAPASRPRLGP